MSDMGVERAEEDLRALLTEDTLLIEVLDPDAAWADLDGDTVELAIAPVDVDAGSADAGLVDAGRVDAVRPTSRAPGSIPITVRGFAPAWAALVETVADELEDRPAPRVLELGASFRTLFTLPPDAQVIGVGRDVEALERNRRLTERVVAHVEDYRPRGPGFDLVVGWYALDNLADPALVVDRVARWTGPGGLVVLAVINPLSPSGLARRLRGQSRLRRSAWPDALRHRLVHRGFTPLLQVYFTDDAPRARLLTRVVTLGLLDPARTDFVGVFRRDLT